MTAVERVTADAAALGFRPVLKAGRLLLVGPGPAPTELVAAVKAVAADLAGSLATPEAMPADLPHVLDYRMRSGVVLHALPRQPVEFFSSNGQHNAAVVRPQIPIGADAWRVGDGPWRPLAELPAAWRPYVDRQRPGPMDQRQAVKGEGTHA